MFTIGHIHGGLGQCVLSVLLMFHKSTAEYCRSAEKQQPIQLWHCLSLVIACQYPFPSPTQAFRIVAYELACRPCAAGMNEQGSFQEQDG